MACVLVGFSVFVLFTVFVCCVPKTWDQILGCTLVLLKVTFWEVKYRVTQNEELHIFSVKPLE